MLDDFCGFTFNGIHTSELNIQRVSNGSRFNESLGASFQDKTAPIEGGDGLLFWDSFYSNKPISIQIAYDSLTEAQLRKLRQVFCAKAIGEFIFDETPYKAYTAKLQAPVQLTAIPFTENGVRVYKGEGTIQFVAYYPYGKSVHKFLDEFDDTFYINKDEWEDSCGMAATKGNYDGAGTTISLLNAGDIEADWQAFYTMTSTGCALTSISLDNGRGQMAFSAIPRKNSNDAYLRLNSRTQLIEGCDSNKQPTGTLYNDCFIAGEFFKLPLGESTFTSNTACAEIKYNYLYY